MQNENTIRTPEGHTLNFKKREAVSLEINVPKDVLESLEEIATRRDLPVKALIKFYVGQGLKQDLAKIYADKVLENTEQVLKKHFKSEEEIQEILQEITQIAA